MLDALRAAGLGGRDAASPCARSTSSAGRRRAASYPMDRQGYKQWRTTLYDFHADLAGQLLAQAGIDAATVLRVKTAIAKKQMANNPDTRLLEDLAALVFIEHYMAAFAGQHPDYDEEKWLGIVRKTWLKMTGPARAFALSGALRLPTDLVPLITKAIA
jgi:hypothetical protein